MAFKGTRARGKSRLAAIHTRRAPSPIIAYAKFTHIHDPVTAWLAAALLALPHLLALYPLGLDPGAQLRQHAAEVQDAREGHDAD